MNILETKRLKRYFGGVKAVDDCSIGIEKGKITSLIGPNGAGKSTMFNIVCGILEEDSGKVFFNGQDLQGFSPEKISNLNGKGISRLFQQTRLFDNLTVTENLVLALDSQDTKFWKNFLNINKTTEEKKAKAIKILEEFGIKKMKDILAGDLSYGQRRLVELAQKIVKPHSMLLLDEPVAGVNPLIRKEIIKILRNLKKSGDTIVIIEHDIDFVLEISDNIIVMNNGKILATGPPNVIKKNPKVLEAYLGK